MTCEAIKHFGNRGEMFMNLRDVQQLLDATILTGEELLDRTVETCCGSDLMSDVLAFTKRNTLLCTGLTNLQVVRTADMTDLCAIVVVRGKIPSEEVLEAAAENCLPILSTESTLFDTCGILYKAGIRGCLKKECSYGRK